MMAKSPNYDSQWPSVILPPPRRRSSAGLLLGLAVTCLLPIAAQANGIFNFNFLPASLPGKALIPRLDFGAALITSDPHEHEIAVRRAAAVTTTKKTSSSSVKTTSSVRSSSKVTTSSIANVPVQAAVVAKAVTTTSSSTKKSSSTPIATTSSVKVTSSSSVKITSSSSVKVSSAAVSSSVKPSSSAAVSSSVLPGQANDKPSRIADATVSDVFRYRYQYGANLGSVWVLERWLFPGMFPNGTSANLTSELAAVQAWVAQVGLDNARTVFEQHWATAIDDEDLAFIANTGKANSVRVPIGFFTLGPAYCKGTVFEPVAGLYQNAWTYVKQAVAKINAAGVGVLIDFHALPGGANPGDHSGTNSGEADFWGSTQYIQLAQSALNFILSEAKAAPGVLGVQVVNEAIYDAPGMYAYYEKLLAGFQSIDNTMPIYISDGWDLSSAITYAKSKNYANSTNNPVVIDSHMYYAFTSADWASTPQQIIAQVPSQLNDLSGQDGAVIPGGGVSVVIGEYSDVMDDQTWARRGNGNITTLTIQFGAAQNAIHRSKAAGEFFWSTKMDPTIYYGGWCFDVQTKLGAINAPGYMAIGSGSVTAAIAQAKSQANATMYNSYNAHVSYWNGAMPNVAFEHWRFLVGWQVGFNDSVSFANMRNTGKMGSVSFGADKIGLMDLWARKRINESGMTGSYVWEFENGLRKGIADFGTLTGAY